jgi:hypothetical protein
MVLSGHGGPSATISFAQPFPLPSLTFEAFQYFCHQFLRGRYPEAKVHPQGKTGHKQEGADIIATFPFVIQWAADSPHPSQDSPKGCEFLSFEMEHPDPTNVIATLRKLGIEATVRQAKEPRLRAALKTPRGRVELN